MTSTECIGLEEALKLTTEFSVRSLEGDIPGGQLVPVPAGAFCEFHARPWSDIQEGERDAFRRFYTFVGGELEELAALVQRGANLDEIAWREITDNLGAQKDPVR